MKRLAKTVRQIGSYEELKSLLPNLWDIFEQVEECNKEKELWQRVKEEYSHMSLEELAEDMKLLNIEDL